MDQKTRNQNTIRSVVTAGIVHAVLILPIFIVGLFFVPRWKTVMSDFDVALPNISIQYLTFTELLFRNGWLALIPFTLLLASDMSSMLLLHRHNQEMVRYWNWVFITMAGALLAWCALALYIPLAMLV